MGSGDLPSSKSDGKRAHPGARASRPHALPLRVAQFPCDGAPGHLAGGNAMGSAEADSWRRCRSTRVEQIAEAVPGLVRAGRPRSRMGFIPWRRRSDGGPSDFVSIRGSSSTPSAVSSSYDLTGAGDTYM